MKTGLVIGGGGRNGAFAAGAIYRLASQYNLTFDIVSGTSTGAIMSSSIITDNIEVLNDLYRGGVSESDILEYRGLISGFLNGSLANTGQLLENVRRYSYKTELELAWSRGQQVVVTVTNMRTGKAERRTSAPENLADWEYYVTASASIPIYMDPVNIHGDDYVDGGLIDLIPVQPVLDANVDHVIVILNTPLEIAPLDENPEGLFERLMRAISIMTAEIARNDLQSLCQDHGAKLTLIAPDRDLGDPLDFDPEVMEQYWLMGFDAAELPEDDGHGLT